MQQKKALIIENKEVCVNHYLLKIEWENANNEFLPGQFIQIKINHNYDPLLRRPFSVFSADQKSIKILYKVVGKGTSELHEKKSGDLLDIIGPLGNGYNTEKSYINNKKVNIIGGGTGSASLFYLIERLSPTNTVNAYFGFKSKEDMFCMDRFENITQNLNIATEDGTCGYKGFITDVIEKDIFDNSVTYICGPNNMTKALHKQIKNLENFDILVSLEEYMGCGTGICNGCVVKLTENNIINYKRVCKDGPVFNLREIVWE